MSVEELTRRINRDYSTAALSFKRITRHDPCVYCYVYPAKKRSSTLEHIVPRSRGGLTHWENLAGACGRCNRAKGDTSLLQFLVRRMQ